jgi:hypothetical protein
MSDTHKCACEFESDGKGTGPALYECGFHANQRRELTALTAENERLTKALEEAIFQQTMANKHKWAIEADLAALRLDAERYQAVKLLSKEQYLAWRGMYGCSDAAIDAARKP